MVQNQEQAAREMVELAISQMKSLNYEGAWFNLNQAKNSFPGLRNLDIMLFASNILRLAHSSKPDCGLNWLEILHLPASAQIASIHRKFEHFIYCLETIKDEFPETALALQILKNARTDICKRESSRHVNFAASDLTRKMPTADCSSKSRRGQSNDKEDGEKKKSRRTLSVSGDIRKESSLNADLKQSLYEAMPQNPHYDPLKSMTQEFCKPIILGIESSFAVVAHQIRSLLTEDDVKRDVSMIKTQLRFLDGMGYDVHKMQLRVRKLCELVEKKKALFVANQERHDEVKEWKNKSRMLEEKNRLTRSAIADMEEKIKKMKESLDANQSDIDSLNSDVAQVQQQMEKCSQECGN